MRILDRLFGRGEQRALTHEDFFGRPRTDGVVVTPDGALGEAAVFACIRVLCNALATAPLHLYERQDNGDRRRANDHPLYRLMHDEPNPVQTSAEFRDQMNAWLEMHGAAFAEVIRADGQAVALWPIHPRVVVVEQSGGALYYKVQTKNGERRVGEDRILHLRNMAGSNTPTGLDIIRALKRPIGAAMAATDHASRFFENAATPSGILTHPASLSEAAQQRLKQQFHAQQTGANAHRELLLEEGLRWEAKGLDAERSQLLETRQYSVVDICRIFGVPPHLVASLDKATYSNIEHQGVEFRTHAVRPRAVRWEQRLNRSLIRPDERGRFYFEHDLDGLARGDILSRYQAYREAIGSGWLSRNEVRTKENLNQAPGLSEFTTMPGTKTAGEKDAA